MTLGGGAQKFELFAEINFFARKMMLVDSSLDVVKRDWISDDGKVPIREQFDTLTAVTTFTSCPISGGGRSFQLALIIRDRHTTDTIMQQRKTRNLVHAYAPGGVQHDEFRSQNFYLNLCRI